MGDVWILSIATSWSYSFLGTQQLLMHDNYVWSLIFSNILANLCVLVGYCYTVLNHTACANPENPWGRGILTTFRFSFCFVLCQQCRISQRVVRTYIVHRWPDDCSNCFPRGVSTRISKEAYNQFVIFQGSPDPLFPPPLWTRCFGS